MADRKKEFCLQYKRERRERWEWSPDVWRDCAIAVLTGIVALIQVHGQNVFENVKVPIISAVVAVVGYEICRCLWNFFVVTPRDMYCEVQESSEKAKSERDEAISKFKQVEADLQETARSREKWEVQAKRDADATLRLTSDLATEHAKNSKPDVAVTIISGTLERSSITSACKVGGVFVEEFAVCITLIANFVNRRPCFASIDMVTLVVQTASGRRIEPRVRSQVLEDSFMRSALKPNDLSELEANLVLTQGIGATRFIQFFALFQKSDRLDVQSGFYLMAKDSFGGCCNAFFQAANLNEVCKSPIVTIS